MPTEIQRIGAREAMDQERFAQQEHVVSHHRGRNPMGHAKYVKADAHQICDNTISDSAKITLLMIKLHCGGKNHTWVSQGIFAYQRGISIRALYRHIIELENARWIEVDRRVGKENIVWVND